jgi:hypothetical protein
MSTIFLSQVTNVATGFTVLVGGMVAVGLVALHAKNRMVSAKIKFLIVVCVNKWAAKVKTRIGGIGCMGWD